MNFSPEQKKLIEKYGSPLENLNNSVKINEALIARLFIETQMINYIEITRSMEIYTPETGLWVGLSEEKLFRMISCFLDQLADHYGIYQIGMFVNTRRIEAIIKFIKAFTSKPNYPRSNHYFIHTANGVLVYNPTTKNLEYQNFSPEYFSRNRTDYNYNPRSQCPRFLNELVKPMLIIPEGVSTLQLYFGQCLLKHNFSQKFIILSGDSGCGKSQFVKILELILGPANVAELHPNCLQDKFELVSYAQKSLLTAKDVDYDALSANRVEVMKKMTGDDLLSVEQKHDNRRIQVEGNFNIIITGNGDITINFGQSREAFERRLLWVRCRKMPRKCDIADLAEELVAEEAEGILAWGVEGARKLINANFQIDISENQKILNRMLMDESEPFVTFVKTCITSCNDNRYYLTSNEMIANYYHFAQIRQWENYPWREHIVQTGIAAAMRRYCPNSPHDSNCRTKDDRRARCNGYRCCSITPQSQWLK